jgi:hypothetical protein
MRNEIEDRLIKHANNVHKNHIYAEILWHFAKKLKNLLKFIKDEIIYFHDCFEKLLSFDCKLFEFNIVDVIASILSSLFDEIDLKKYFKINALLKFMQCVLVSNKWRKIFEKKHANSFFFITIATNFISIWMKFNQKQKKKFWFRNRQQKNKNIFSKTSRFNWRK